MMSLPPLLLLFPLVMAQLNFNGNTSVLFNVDDNRVTDGNVVTIEVFGEALCPDTTRFLRNHLLQLWKHYGPSGRLNITYHPFGVTRSTVCTPVGDDDFQCQCQHGVNECVLNSLQSCVIFALPRPEDHLDTVVCIQSKRTLSNAISQCIENAETRPNLDAKFMEECATSPLGRRLMAGHGDSQHRMAPSLYWVPWIMMDGERNKGAERNIWKELCDSYLRPQPIECARALY